MRAIQRHVPNPRHVEVHRITVRAPPEVAWQAARQVDAGNIVWGCAGTTRLLEERSGVDLVVGTIGPFGKVAWSVHVEPEGRGSQITLELRMDAPDDESWTRLARSLGVGATLWRLSRSWMMSRLKAKLGGQLRPDDERRVLPGDTVLPDAHYSLTHGLDIEAPPAIVWPWLMQIGCDRGGWYSIDALDHEGIPSVDRVMPTWAERRVGEKVATGPAHDHFYDIAEVKTDALLVLRGDTKRFGGHVTLSWAFVLEPLGEDATHLVTRVRASATPRWLEWLQGKVIFPPIHAVMQHAQLANIKRLAERDAHARG